MLGGLYDAKTKRVAGELTKKGGSSGGGMFSKRNWNKRVFVIETDIDDTHNYTMKYFKENAKKESGLVPLQGTRVVMEHKEHASTDVGCVALNVPVLPCLPACLPLTD